MSTKRPQTMSERETVRPFLLRFGEPLRLEVVPSSSGPHAGPSTVMIPTRITEVSRETTDDD
jgi:hypothetical protein